MLWDKTFPNLNRAVRALVSGDASLHDRLEEAIRWVETLSEKHFPPTIVKEYNQLLEDIQAYRASGERAGAQPGLALAIFALLKHFIVEAWPPSTPLNQV